MPPDADDELAAAMSAKEYPPADADRWAIACNYREGTKVARYGARAYVGWGGDQGGGGRARLVVTSRSGRLIAKWDLIHRLTNFRATCIPAANGLRKRRDVALYETRSAAEAEAAKLMVVSRRDATARTARPA